MLASLFPFSTNSNSESQEQDPVDTNLNTSFLERSSFLGYLDNASTVIEHNPELMSSVGFGPVEPTPVVTNLSPSISFIEDYKGDKEKTSDHVNSAEQSRTESGTWFFDLIQTLNGWLYTSQAAFDYSHKNLRKKNIRLSCDDVTPPIVTPEEEEEFWSEWEWVLSRTEELAIQQSSQQAKQIDDELKNLRRSANHLKQRPYFVAKAQYLLSCNTEASDDEDEDLQGIFTEEEIQMLETIPLSASLRSKLLRDVVDQFSGEWLEYIGKTFFHTSSDEENEDSSKYPIFIENYTEKPYAKNVTGALVSIGFVASHGSDQSFTAQVLGDILWSWWSTLVRSIQEITAVPAALSEALAKQVLRAAPVIARVWYETLLNTKNLHAPGSLPEQWKMKEQEEANRLKQLRAVGMIDAKFRDGPSQVGTLHSTMSPQRLAEVKKKLEEQYYRPSN